MRANQTSPCDTHVIIMSGASFGKSEETVGVVCLKAREYDGRPYALTEVASYATLYGMVCDPITLNTANTLLVLALDDAQYRIAAFKQQWRDHILVCVETVDDAIFMMHSFRFDIVFLDHDLNGEKRVDSSRKDCGAEVARWLADPANELCVPRRVIIHTHYDQGRIAMAKLLPSALVCARTAWEYAPEDLLGALAPAHALFSDASVDSAGGMYEPANKDAM